MNWLNPAMGWWALAALPVIALYVLKIRRRRQEVSTSMFWEQVFEEASPRAWWQRLRNLMSLLVQLLFLLLLVLALMDPLSAGQEKDRRLLVLAVDTSASMEAGEGNEQRIALAAERARDLLKGLRAYDQAVLLAVDDEVRVLCGRTGNTKAVETALESLEARRVTARPEKVYDFVQQLPLEGRVLDLHWITDTQGAQSAPPLPEEMEDLVRWHVVGDPQPNLALTAFDIRPFEANPFFVQLLVTVHNGGGERAKASVQLRRNEVLFDTLVVEVEPYSSRTVMREEELADPGVFSATLRDGGALTGDDVFQLVITPPRTARVALVGPRNLFLEGLLGVHPLVMFDRYEAAEVNQVDWSMYELAVFDKVVPDEAPACDQWYIGPEADSAWWKREEGGGVVVLDAAQPDHPLLRHVDLPGVYVRRGTYLNSTAPTDWSSTVLARSNGEPVLTSWSRGRRQVLAMGFGLSDSDLALRTAFPILFANALDYFAERDSTARRARETGEFVDLSTYDPPIQVLQHPDGRRTNVSGLTRWGPLQAPGVYRLLPDAEAETYWPLAVNLVAPEEADTGVELTAPEGDRWVQPALSGASGHPLWWWLLLVAVLLSAAEWALYNRRRLE